MQQDLGVSVAGHLLIKEHDGNQTTTLVDKFNAIHPQNMSRIIARALANEQNSYIYRMAFGNGGTVTDPTGKVILNSPNDGTINGWEARLYNETYSEVVDESSSDFGSDPGSAEDGNVRVGSGSYSPTAGDPDGGVTSAEVGSKSNVIIRVFLSKDEPTGQVGTINDFGVAIDENEATFVFDEIGLYSPGKAAAATSGSTSVDVGNKTSDDIMNLDVGTVYQMRYTVNGSPYTTEVTTPAGGSHTSGALTFGDFCEGLNTGDWVTGGADFNTLALAYITDRSNGGYPSITDMESYGLLTFKTLATGINSGTLTGEEIDLDCDSTPDDLFLNLFDAAEGYCAAKLNVSKFLGGAAGVQNDAATQSNERERLLTHIVFPPITKSGDKAVSIEYTLTITVSKTKDSRVVQTSTTG